MTAKIPAAKKEQQYNSLSSQELSKLIKEAQNGNQEAKLQLCLAFEPLIKHCAKKSEVAAALGEEAESIGWLIFLDCIAKLDTEKMTAIKPGYFKVVIRNRLNTQLIKAYSFTKCHLLQDAPAGLDFTISFEDETINDMVLQTALASLTPREKQFISWRYFEGLSYEKIAELLHKSPFDVRKFGRNIIRKMRKHYKAIDL